MSHKNKRSNIWQIFTPGDRLVYILLISLSALSLFAIHNLQPEGNEVVVESQNKVVYSGSIFDNQHLEIKGLIGTTVIEIKNGKVWVSQSDCPHQICVATGKIHRAGDVIVCIPNKVVVKVKKHGRSTYDAITG